MERYGKSKGVTMDVHSVFSQCSGYNNPSFTTVTTHGKRKVMFTTKGKVTFRYGVSKKIEIGQEVDILEECDDSEDERQGKVGSDSDDD